MIFKKAFNKITGGDDPKKEDQNQNNQQDKNNKLTGKIQQPSQPNKQKIEESKTKTQPKDEFQINNFDDLMSGVDRDTRLITRDATRINQSMRQAQNRPIVTADQMKEFNSQSKPTLVSNSRPAPVNFMNDLLDLRTNEIEKEGFAKQDDADEDQMYGSGQVKDDYQSNFFNDYERKPKSTLPFPTRRQNVDIDAAAFNQLSQSNRYISQKIDTDSNSQPNKSSSIAKPEDNYSTQIPPKVEPLKPVQVPITPSKTELKPIVIPDSQPKVEIQKPIVTVPTVYPKVEPVKLPPKLEAVKIPSTQTQKSEIVLPQVVSSKETVNLVVDQSNKPSTENRVFTQNESSLTQSKIQQNIKTDDLKVQQPPSSILSNPLRSKVLNQNHGIQRNLDLDLDDEENDEVNPLTHFEFKRGRGKDGHSAALERIMEKRQRGSQLPMKNRPTLDPTDFQKMTLLDPQAQRSTSLNDPSSFLNPTLTKNETVPVPSSNPGVVPLTPSKQQTSAEQKKQIEEVEQDDSQFFDYSQKRAEVQRLASERRSAVRKNVTGPLRLQQQKQEELERNTSDSDLTDKQFEDNISIDSDEIEQVIQKAEINKQKLILEHGKTWVEDNIKNDIGDKSGNSLNPKKQISKDDKSLDQVLYEIDIGNQLNDKISDPTTKQEEEDFLDLITQNENMFKQYGEKKLKDQRNSSMQSAKSLQKFKENASLQSVLAEPQIQKNIKFPANTVETCIAIQNEILLVGTSSGQLYAFNINTEKLIGVHKEDGKDFLDNSITSIDIHSRRPEYCVIGFEKGQLALINILTINKTVKLIKDHHKKPVVSVKFCDWAKEKPHLKLGANHVCKECENVNSWMFVSCDTSGKVVQNTITNVSFGLMYANDYIMIDPLKMSPEDPIYQVLAPRISSREKPLEIENDIVTLVALGSTDNVAIWVTPEKGQIERLVIDKPKRYPSQNMDDVMPVMSQFPILAWGFGKTPRYNFQTFPLLAIAWGPVIQLVVFKDITSLEEHSDFDIDGYYIIAPEKPKGVRSPNNLDTSIQSLHFLDESLLVAVTSNQEIRVMFTQKFKEKDFVEPQYLEIVNFDQLDSRCKMMPVGSQLSPQQFEIEMERKCVLTHPLTASKFGGTVASQTQSVFDDKIACLTSGGIYVSHHLNWLESLGNLESSVVQGSWIEIFAKALEIYTGKVKGLRIKGEDERKDNMRDQLKQMIDKQVVQIILSWKSRAEANIKSGTMNQMQVQEDLNSKFQTLIRIVIEFCVEIQEPVFLFDTLLKKFHIEGKSMLFAEELKPYILSGHFAECIISESILREQILQHYQKIYQESYEQIKSGVSGDSISAAISPAENFEKILINFRFDSCSKEYKLELIDYCKEYGLTSALMYMCLNCYGEQGPLQALTLLKDFYLDTFANEAMGESVLQREDLQALYTMPANYFDRILLERSSCYLGLKLLWIARLFLLGKKFPRGHFTTQEWHVLCHDIMELITQDDLIQLLTEIDAEGYFQIVSIVFNNPSSQFNFIEKGRPAQIPQNYQGDTINVSHDLIVQRISSYFNQQSSSTDPSHIHYLCFIASIAGSYEKCESTEKDERLYYDVALELLKHSDMLIHYNKEMLKRRMTNRAMFRRLSRMGNDAPDETKHLVLSESMLLMLIERSKLVVQNKKELNQMLKACENTDFHNVKLVLYELNDDYLKCLQLFMQNNKKRSTDGQMKEAITWKGRQDGFAWIQDKHAKLQSLAIESKGEVQKNQLINFEKEVLSQVMYLVKQNILQAIKLCDAVFKSAHMDFLDKLQSEQQLQLTYIQQLLDLKRQEIKESLTSSGNSVALKSQAFARSASGENQKWISILSLHIRLICQLDPSRLTQEIEKVIKDNFYPMEECLKICVEYKQIEASALLNKKIGNYQNAITLYLQILKQGLNYDRLKKELFYFDKENKRHIEKERQALFLENQARFKQRSNAASLVDLQALLVQQAVKTVLSIQIKDRRADLYRVWVEKFGKNIDLLDRSLDKIQNICKSHPKEVLIQNEECWQTVLTFLFSILFHPNLRKKSYCKRHLKLKMVEFCRCILQYVPFNRIIYAASSLTKTLRFKAVKELVNDVFADKSQEFEMCENADTTQARDLLYLQQQVQDVNTGGISFSLNSLTCGICEKIINGQAFKSTIGGQSNQEDNKIFDCFSQGTADFNHSFHLRCLKKLISEEHDKDRTKKAPPKDAELIKYFRCPSCYPKSQDVIIVDPSTSQNKKGQKEDKSGGDSNSDEESKSQGNQQKNEASQAIQQSILAKKQMTFAMKKQIYREKQMKRFEESVMLQETLSLGDFNMN